MNHLLFLGNLGAGEILLIALIVLLLLGGKKITELMKGRQGRPQFQGGDEQHRKGHQLARRESRSPQKVTLRIRTNQQNTNP